MSTSHFIDNSKDSVINYVKQFSHDPINLLQTNFTKTKVEIEQVGWERMQIFSGSSNLSTKHSFRIPYGDGFVGSQALVISLTAAGLTGGGAGVSYVSAVGCQIIKTVEIFIAGKSVHKYSGRALFQYLMFANKAYENGRANLVSLISGTIAANTATGYIIVPLLMEGNNCIVGETHRPFPIGATKTDMQIDIDFDSTANVTTTVPAAPPTTFAEAPYLLYNKYEGSIHGKRLIGRSLGSNQLDPVFTYKITDLQYYEKTVTLATTLTDLQITQTPIFNKHADCLALLLLSSLSTGDQLIGVDNPLISFKKGNDYLYRHDSLIEGTYNSLMKTGETTIYTSTYPQYVIPLAHNLRNCLKDDIIMAGINLFQQQTTLSISATAAAHVVKFCGLFNSFTNIMEDGSIRQVFQYDPKYLTISPIPKIIEDKTIIKQ
jgi:hypothetical protein